MNWITLGLRSWIRWPRTGIYGCHFKSIEIPVNRNLYLTSLGDESALLGEYFLPAKFGTGAVFIFQLLNTQIKICSRGHGIPCSIRRLFHTGPIAIPIQLENPTHKSNSFELGQPKFFHFVCCRIPSLPIPPSKVVIRIQQLLHFFF